MRQHDKPAPVAAPFWTPGVVFLVALMATAGFFVIARYTGGLWVGMYMKVVTHMETDVDASLKLAKYAETQGAYERMDAHRYAATIRLENLKK